MYFIYQDFFLNCFRLGSGGHVLSGILLVCAPFFNHQTIMEMALYDTQNPFHFQPHRTISKVFLTLSSGHIPIITEEDPEPPPKKTKTSHDQGANVDMSMVSSLSSIHAASNVSLGSMSINEQEDEAFHSAYGTFLEGMDSDLEEMDSESDLDGEDETFHSAQNTFSESMRPGDDVLDLLLGGSQPTISKSQERVPQPPSSSTPEGQQSAAAPMESSPGPSTSTPRGKVGGKWPAFLYSGGGTPGSFSLRRSPRKRSSIDSSSPAPSPSLTTEKRFRLPSGAAANSTTDSLRLHLTDTTVGSNLNQSAIEASEDPPQPSTSTGPDPQAPSTSSAAKRKNPFRMIAIFNSPSPARPKRKQRSDAIEDLNVSMQGASIDDIIDRRPKKRSTRQTNQDEIDTMIRNSVWLVKMSNPLNFCWFNSVLFATIHLMKCLHIELAPPPIQNEDEMCFMDHFKNLYNQEQVPAGPFDPHIVISRFAEQYFGGIGQYLTHQHPAETLLEPLKEEHDLNCFRAHFAQLLVKSKCGNPQCQDESIAETELDELLVKLYMDEANKRPILLQMVHNFLKAQCLARCFCGNVEEVASHVERKMSIVTNGLIISVNRGVTVKKPCKHGPYPCSNRQKPCPVQEKKLNFPIQLTDTIEMPIVGMTQKATYKLQACVEHIGTNVQGGTISETIHAICTPFKDTFNFTF